MTRDIALIVAGLLAVIGAVWLALANPVSGQAVTSEKACVAFSHRRCPE